MSSPIDAASGIIKIIWGPHGLIPEPAAIGFMEIPANQEDPFYILATDSAADEATRVLKHGEAFAVFNRHSDIDSTGLGQQGLLKFQKCISHRVHSFRVQAGRFFSNGIQAEIANFIPSTWAKMIRD